MIQLTDIGSDAQHLQKGLAEFKRIRGRYSQPAPELLQFIVEHYASNLPRHVSRWNPSIEISFIAVVTE